MDINYEENLKRGHKVIKRLEFLQYSYFDGKPKWTTIQKNDLKLFMAYTYYGYPLNDENNDIDKNENDINNEVFNDIFMLYKKKDQKNILAMIEKIKNKIVGNSIEVGVTITHSICNMKCKLLDTTDTCLDFPNKDLHQWKLIRIKLGSQVFFIDFLHRRTYKNWDDYMENNTLPDGYIFYTKSGFYDEADYLLTHITPASRKTNKIIKNVDLSMRVSNFVGGVSLACGLMFPIATPIVLIAAVTVGTSSLWQTGRQSQNLINIYQHNECLSKKELSKEWVSLAIAAIGSVTAAMPLKALSSVTTDVNLLNNSTIMRQSLSLFQKSACITQCSLEIIHTTLKIVDKKSNLRWHDVLLVRLDLFLITGSLVPIKYVMDIIKAAVSQAVWLPIYKSLEKIHYCLSQFFCKSVYFFKMHLDVFLEKVKKFLKDRLTMNNLLFAWQKIRELMIVYQKQKATLDSSDLLRHVVDGVEADESVKCVLRGPRMVELLDSMWGGAAKTKVHWTQVKFCVDRVLLEAEKLSVLQQECMADLIRRGETRDKVDEQFCAMYGLERCAKDQYVLYAIRELARDPAALLAEYLMHSSLPENVYNNELVASDSSGGTDGAHQSVKVYSMFSPSDGALDADTCMQFANTIDPQPCRFADHQFVQPEPGVSILLRASAFSHDIVLFGVELLNGVPKMYVCFFRTGDAAPKSPVSNPIGLPNSQY